MTANKSLATKLLNARQALDEDPKKRSTCFVGFDGFTDEIIEVVDKRQGLDQYQSMSTMTRFGKRILDSAGKSCNIELVVRETKVGGNGPILTLALLEGGHRITFAGAIGLPGEIEPLFQEMAARCEGVISLCSSGHSDALEFQDGKVILGKHASFIEINHETLLQQINKKQLTRLLDSTDLFVSANWTMVPGMTALWSWLHETTLPNFSERHRWLFVDLADPAKRTDEDIAKGLKVLKKLGETYHVILGLNEAEALRVGSVLNTPPRTDEEGIVALHKKSGLHTIVLHATRYAFGVGPEKTAKVQGPYTPTPVLTTGGGDNFNAGFCNALLYGFSLKEALLSGVATSGYYVRNGRSPTIPELAAFLQAW